MTMPYELEDQETSEGDVNPLEPIPVIIHRGEGERVAPEFSTWMTYSIPTASQGGAGTGPIQLCPHRYHRYKAKFIAIIQPGSVLYLSNRREYLTAGPNGSPSGTVFNIPNPAVSTATATASFAAAGNGTATLPVGNSLSSLSVDFGAVTTANTVPVTVTGAVGGTQTFDVPLAINTNPTTFTQNFAVPLTQASPATPIAVTVTGNLNSPAGTILAQSPTGSQIMVTIPDYDGQQPIYALATGTVTVNVMDESYGIVQLC